MASKYAAYVDSNKDQYINDLIEVLKIPSISADSKYADEVIKTAEKIKSDFEAIGVDKAEICDTVGFPVVYAEKMVDSAAPTVLVYGHYDVQPPDPLDLWTSPPFEPVIKNEKIYARGAADDKGQVYMHLKALQVMNDHNDTPCNMKFIIEGEEEVGSPSLEGWIRDNKEKLAADVILISDTAIINNETPSVTVGLRGLSYLEIEVTGPDKDLHSGVFGGAVGNPINILCEMIASLKDENNHITIPGFYDDVVELTTGEREEMAKEPFDINAYKDFLKVDDVHGENGYSSIERTSIRPTLDVNGIWGGYTGEGAKTVLPSKAYAKISMRLVPNQDSHKITEMFQNHFQSIAPPSVKVSVTPHHGGEPYLTPTDFPAFKAASLAMEETFGKKPIPSRGGGSIPIVAMFEKVLGLKSILMGFSLDTDDIHSPDEHFGVFNYLKGIETIPLFYKHYAELAKN